MEYTYIVPSGIKGKVGVLNICRIKEISTYNKQYIVPAFQTCNLGSIPYGGNVLCFWYEIRYSTLGLPKTVSFFPGIPVSSCINTNISNLNQEL